MSKRTVWAIIALMLIGLLGIIAVQVYWLARASALEQSLFKQRVHRALNNVAQQLEIRETKALIMHSLNNMRKTAEAVKHYHAGSSLVELDKRFVERRRKTTAVHKASLRSAKHDNAHQKDSSVLHEPVTWSQTKTQNSITEHHRSQHSSSNGGGNNIVEMRFGNAQFSVSLPPKEQNAAERYYFDNKAPQGTAELASEAPAVTLTVSRPDGQPLRIILRNTRRHSVKRDSVIQRLWQMRNRNQTYGNNADSNTAAQNVRTVRERVSPNDKRKEMLFEQSWESSSHQVGRQGLTVHVNNRPVLSGSVEIGGVLRELGRWDNTGNSALRQVQLELLRSRRMIERLRRLNGDTRDVDSVMALVFRRLQSMDEVRMDEGVTQLFDAAFDTLSSSSSLDVEDKQFAQKTSVSSESQQGSSVPNNCRAFVASGSSARKHRKEVLPHSWVAHDTLSTVVEKMDLIENILENMVARKRAVLERVTMHEIQGLLAAEFREHGIQAPYEYGIVHLDIPARGYIADTNILQSSLRMYNHEYARVVAYAAMPQLVYQTDTDSARHRELLISSEYRVQLFPNDIMASEDREYLSVYFLNESGKQGMTFAGIAPVLGLSVVFLVLIVGCFAFTFVALMRQKKLSDMKTDFINNMTHELKTPIATIAIASEALKDEHIRSEASRLERFLNVIHDENKRLASHVEKVLHAAQMERGELQLRRTSLNLHDLIATVAESLALQVGQKQGHIELRLEAHSPIVQADEEHLCNVLINLLDNANKYTPTMPHIVVTTRNTSAGLAVAVQDNGIGMTREAQKQIFEKFYRVPTGNRHDVKGFGLGLSYVKTIVEAHGGTVTVKSELGKGSTFEIVLPSDTVA
ncbi:MAG: HAMP domain-containing sensor histidine kinase [Bacteroidota bacterium]|nr:HAMP domain-containing histidine kinase [Candidatus Kapabacteria bacterium]MDW8219930.1 HAMP domain-containing sensor histidine kinase [Bacteroidota bacterium]